MAESVARGRINWGVLGVEAAAIFTSVLLGFAVSEWREARGEAERRGTLLAAFATEVAENRERLVANGTYHHWLARAMSEGMASGEVRTLADAFGIENMTGFNSLDVERTAWATATATGDIALLDFGTARALWRLYDAQRAIDAEQTRLRSEALAAIGAAESEPVAPFVVALREFTSLERELLDLLNAAGTAVADARGEPRPEVVETRCLSGTRSPSRLPPPRRARSFGA